MKNKKKLVLITGASQGIGRVMADCFVKNNYNVVFCYNRTKILQNNTESEFFIHMDISSRESVKNAITESEEYFGSTIDIVVNNAAIAQEKTFFGITDEDWQNMLNVNLQGAFRVTQEVLPNMIKNSWGRIINISSVGGQWGGFNQVHYAASKAALINFTQSIAKLYSKDGITSNAIAIGLVETNMSAKELKSEAGKKKIENIPVGRLGKKDEVAKVALFLASRDSAYLTGQTINVNGGMYFG